MATPEEALASMTANLAAKTGRNLEEWLAAVRASGQSKHGQIVTWLKAEHGLGHGYANLIAHHALGSSSVAPPPATAASGGDPADEIYAGPKTALRPVHDALMNVIRGFGEGLDEAPKKGYLSLRRKKQFALIQPSTATRVDLGLALKGVEPAGRLEASGSWNAMVSHRVKLATPADVDAEVAAWLRQAWDAAG